MTTIEDVLTYIDGSNANGRLVVAWKPFTVGNVNAAGGELEWPIVDGEVSISLYANTGAQPTGSYYVAKYELENGAVYLEQWVVPNLPTVNLGQVRVSFPPSPSVMISPLQLTSLNAQPGMFLQWDGQRWVPAYPSTFNIDPNWIGINTDATGNDVGVIGSPVHLGNSVTIHIPDAGLTSRGVVTTSPQSFGGVKTFANTVNISTSIKFTLRSVAPVYGELLGFGTGGADTSLSFGGNIIASRVSPVDRPYVRADSFIGSSLDLATFGIVPTAVMPGSLANPARTLAAFLLPVAGTVDWTGIGTDTTGALWLRTGTSTSAGFLYLDTAGNVTAREFRMDPYQHLNAPGVEATRNDATMVMYSGTTDWAGYGVNSTPEMWFRMGPNAAGAYYYFGAGGARFPGNLTVGNIVVTGGVTLPAGTYVPTSRRVNTSTGLTGGGPLTADLTLSAVDNTTTQKVEAAQAGLVKAVRKRLNFIAGAGQLITVVDDSGNDQANVTITSSTSGSATPSIYSVNGTPVGTQPELNLVAGANVILNGVNNGGLNRVDITVTTSGGAAITDPTTAIGDLVVRGTATPSPLTRLGVGATTGYVLTTDLTTAPFIKWADRVPITRQIIAGAGLGGGGALGGIAATDVTLTANVVSVNGQTGAVVLTAANVGGVPTTRQVIAGTGLTGGGPLSSDVTLAVVNDTVTERVRISNAGTLVGTRQQINFIQGSNITLTVADVPGSNWVGVTVAATTSGLSDPTTTKGDLIVRPVGPPATRMGVGVTDGMVLTVDSTDATFGIKWKAVPAGFVDPTTTKGDLIARATAGPATRLGVGTDGWVLTASAADALGVKWAAVPLSPQTPWTQDIDGAGFKLSNVSAISTGSYVSDYKLLLYDGSPAFYGWGVRANQFMQYCAISAAMTFGQMNGATFTERVRIDAAGNVGIGTTSPLATLETSRLRDTGYGLRLTVTGLNGIGQANSMDFYDVTGANQMVKIQSVSEASWGANLQFWTKAPTGSPGSTTERMRIDGAGNVGIGTVSPQSPLHVFKGQSGVVTAIIVGNDNGAIGSGQAIRFGFDLGTNLGGVYHQQAADRWYLRLKAWSNSAETERLTIDGSNGSVGIGTTSPVSKLSFGGSVTNNRIAFFENGSGGSFRGVGMAQGPTGYGTAIWALSAAGTTPTDANMGLFVMDDANGGKIGIGTANPGYKLDATGDVNTGGYFKINGGRLGNPQYVVGSGGAMELGAQADVPGLTLTTSYTGWYLVIASVYFLGDSAVANLGRVWLLVGAAQHPIFIDYGPGSGTGTQNIVTCHWHYGGVGAGTIVKLQAAKMSAGGSVRIVPGSSQFSLIYLGP